MGRCWSAVALAVTVSVVCGACAAERIEAPPPGSLSRAFTVATVRGVSDLVVTTASGRLIVGWRTGAAGEPRHVAESGDAGRSWHARRAWGLAWLGTDVAPDAHWQAEPQAGAYVLRRDDHQGAPLVVPTLGATTTLVWAGADVSGDLFSVWRGPADGQLRIIRHALASQVHLSSKYLGIPVTLTTGATPHSRVSAAALPGGAVIAWVEARGAEDAIVVRIIGFDQLCGLPMPARP
ncbi:MAG: hypothetical protein ABL986_21625 [Vicinamibacterales bacterium]